MLHIFLGTLPETEAYYPNLVSDPDAYFNMNFQPHWIDNDLAKRMVLDVDKSEVQSPYCILSPIFGQIAPEKLSGGVKALMLMLQDDDPIVMDATHCGNNCAKWILEIAMQQDIHIVLGYPMRLWEYVGKVEMVVLNDKKQLETEEDYIREYVQWL